MMSQMSVRIDEQLRVEGNRAFEEVGWSPSQAVCALWGYAARNRHNPRKLREVVDLLEGAVGREEEKPRPSEAVLRGPRLYDEFCEKHGLDRSKPREVLSYEELKEEAFLERWTERGLL